MPGKCLGLKTAHWAVFYALTAQQALILQS